MKVYLENTDKKYAVSDMLQLYFPQDKLEFSENPLNENKSINVFSSEKCGKYFYKAELYLNLGGTDTKKYEYQIENNEFKKSDVKYCIFKAFEKAYGKDLNPPWGILTGIRPSKNVCAMYDGGKTDDEISKILKDDYLVSDRKIKLVKEVAKNERRIIKNLKKDKISLYVSIPFCPTRCLYCSFISQSVAHAAKLFDPYINALFKEIEETAKIVKNYEIETVYIGGGTPTTLSAELISNLIKKLRSEFDLSKITEFTVEAGRPDTIDEEKLLALKENGVTRISINPQTMNDKTLKIIGRRHSADDITEKFNLARKVGFSHINMDLIAGLPKETLSDFKYSLDTVSSLNPDSITVHSLCVKHGSYLDEMFRRDEITKNTYASDMIDYAVSEMEKAGKVPYYMYRQKNMAGNLENIGFCNPGCECYYNIYIMQEVQTIVSLGAGGSTKLVSDESIERVFNVKEVSEYINRIDEMIDRKKRLLTTDKTEK